MEEEAVLVLDAELTVPEAKDLWAMTQAVGWPVLAKVIQKWKLLEIANSVGNRSLRSRESEVQFHQAQGALCVIAAIQAIPDVVQEVLDELPKKPLDKDSQK